MYPRRSAERFLSDSAELFGQFVLGGFGVVFPADARDLSADFVNWEWAWSHSGQTWLDVLAVLPLVGVVKYADEVSDVCKQLVKNADEVGVEAVKTGISDAFRKK